MSPAEVLPATDTVERERAAMAAVDLARHPDRPRALHVIAAAFDGFTELRGDRLFGDDRAVVGGLAFLAESHPRGAQQSADGAAAGGSGPAGRWVMVIGQEKGTDALTRAVHNFGMPHPEGYRKAQRLMRLAENFSLPVVCLVDTPAAHPGIGAEERGQAWAIAASLLIMLGLRTPIVSAVLSEGGSGGALALAVADRVVALENAVYTVAPPETCAAILYRDSTQRARAAAALRPGVDTASRLGLVDELVPEPPPGAHAHHEVVIAALRGAIVRHLDELCALPVDELLARRAQRYRAAGD
jgi:acetyl-CoA carboxylase carboxyl transferase alpha subunit